MSFFIISVDGGGIRGVLPAVLLRALGQAQLDKADFFTGTSTGGLLVTGLASNVPIDRIADTYLDPAMCHKIFTPYFHAGARTPSHHHGILDRLKALFESEAEELLRHGLGEVIEEMLYPMYTSDGLKEIIESFMLPATIGQITRRLLMPTFKLDARARGGPQWHATAFHNLPDGTGIDGHPTAPPVDAVLATTAAPMFFPPHPYDGHLFVDGGVMAQNPTMVAIAAATRAGLIGPRSPVPYSEVKVLSIGTGRNESAYPPAGIDFPPPYGIMGWEWPKPLGDRTPAFPLTTAVFDGVAELTHYQVGAILGDENYRRVQLDLGTTAIAMNDCGCIKGPGGLQARAEQHMTTREWADVVAWVNAITT